MNKWLGLMVVVVIALMGTLTVAAHDPRQGREGRAEIRFLEGMIDHHQMALDMAEDCLNKAETEAVRELCQNVIDAQTAEIELMQGWLLAWYNIDYSPMPMSHMMEMMGDMGMNMGNMGDMGDHDMGDMGDHDMGDMGNMGNGDHYYDPPMMMGMFAGFNRLEGIDYEIAWLESMIDHHDDALHMSERYLERAPNGHEEVRELAEQIIADQTNEIEYMEDLLLELDGSTEAE